MSRDDRLFCKNSHTKLVLFLGVLRHVEGNADMIRDLLEETDKSILLLGEVRLFCLCI